MDALYSKSRQRSLMCILAVCNAGALLAAASLVLVLNPEDRISVRRGGALTLLGLVYFTSLSELLNALALGTGAGARLRHKYRLTAGDVLDITNKVVSAVQAALSCVTGVVVCAWSCARDFLRTSHFASEAYAWFGAAYFFYDIWSMYMVYVHMHTGVEHIKSKLRKTPKNGSATLSAGDGGGAAGAGGAGGAVAGGGGAAGAGRRARISFLQYCRYEPVILMHHVFIGGFGFLVIVYLRGGLGDCVFGAVYLMELSTPFVSLRGILSRLRLKATRLYVANGLLMLATFAACRVLALPYLCLVYSRLLNLTYIEAIKSLPTGCKVSISLLLLPQLYWFYLMCAGAVKVLLPARPSPASPAAPAAPGAPGEGVAAGDAR